MIHKEHTPGPWNRLLDAAKVLVDRYNEGRMLIGAIKGLENAIDECEDEK